MSVSISISDANFGRLQRLAEPLVDTIDDVVSRLIDRWEGASSSPPSKVADDALGANNGGAASAIFSTSRHSKYSGIGDNQRSVRFCKSETPPDLTHTRLISASYDGHRIDRPKWSTLLVVAVRNAMARLGSFEALRKIAPIAIERGSRKDKGFQYYPDIDVSIQGQDTDKLWKAVMVFAQRIGCHVEVEFEWRERDGSAFPSEIGRMEFSPRSIQADPPRWQVAT